MMKLVFLIFFFVGMPEVFGKDCKVYGISDSPQKMSCSFPHQKIDLSCKNGIYYLNNSEVSSAYHEEVETGSSPLVFKAEAFELTVIINSKVDIVGELTINGKAQTGHCL